MEKHQVLCNSGFNVTSSSDFRSVKSLIRKQPGKFALLVVGPSVPELERAQLARLFRHSCPQGDVILFYRGSIRNGQGASALLSEVGSPENLLQAIFVLHNQREQGLACGPP